MESTPKADNLEDAVKIVFGAGVHIAERRPVGGGCISRSSELRLSNDESVFLKEASGDPRAFEREANGLAALARAGGPRVPRPLAIHRGGRFLVLEFIRAGRSGRSFADRLGRELAAMHRFGSDSGYGFGEDNFIGSTVQENGWMDSWTAFFAERRLGFQLELAARNGTADRDLAEGIESIMARIPNLLVEPQSPSLLHGDLWSGNYLADESGAPVLIDPAVYYGHREADLAMTELFGRPDKRFYEAYDEAWPLQPGYDERRDLYNLYHLLNHLNLFGGSYEASVRRIVRRYR